MTPQPKKWLVVGPAGQVLHFETEAEAKKFLRAEAEVCAPDIEAEASGVSVERIIADRIKKGRGRRRAGLLDDLALQPVLNRDRGFSPPLEVVSVKQFRGKVFSGRGIDDYLRGHTFHAPGPFRLSEQCFAHAENIVEIEEGEDGAPEQTGVLLREIGLEPVLRCYLDDDWGFPEMAEHAARCPGHNFVDRQTGTAEVAVGLLGDLQATLRRFWPNLPVAAVASFWRSWQIHSYIAEFFAEFAHSAQAKKLAGKSLRPISTRTWARASTCRADLPARWRRLRAKKRTLAWPSTDPVPQQSNRKSQVENEGQIILCFDV